MNDTRAPDLEPTSAPAATPVATPAADPALDAALAAFARIAEAADRPGLGAHAPRALGGSPYLAGLCTRREAAVAALAGEGALDADADTAARDAGIEARLEARVAPLEVAAGDDAAALAALRDVRHAEQFRLLWHAIAHGAPLEDTFRALTALADACTRVAWRRARARTERRHGLVRDAHGAPLDLVIVAMGKLGGGELNVSSDIDLIGLHPGGGLDSDGDRPLSPGEWFARAFREACRLLAARTADGIAFRVDVRLRPFGESGPPVSSLGALERYWQDHGRDWERYAMVKARALTGGDAAIAAFEALRRPFVYRRYPDYAAIASLRELKAMIATAAAERAARRRAVPSGGARSAADPGRRFAGDDDVKLGRGGIREVEFVVQAHQLVRGGRESALTARALVPALRALGTLGLVPEVDVRALEAAYRALRRVENALQAVHDAQTHVLPEDPADRARVALLLGAPDFAAARADLDEHRAAVADRFDALFEGEGIGTGTAREEVTGTAGGDPGPEPAPGPADGDAPGLSRLGLSHPALAALREGPARRRLPERSAARLDALLPRVLEAVDREARHPHGGGAAPAPVTLARVADFLGAAAGRGGYLQVLLDRPAVLARLVSLFARSAWVAREMRDHPVLVESLLADRKTGAFDPEASPEGASGADADAWRRAVHAAAGRALTGVPPDDLEAGMAKLRRFRRAAAFDIAVARLDGALTLMQTSDRSSWLAEAVVARALERVTAPLRARHGVPTVPVGTGPDEGPDARGAPAVRPVALAVIAYGKLGGLELSPDSDLDLVFLHDGGDAAGGESDGPEPIPNALWHARLVRRFTHFMATPTEAGALYEIDLRLRPNGTAGMLVTSVEAFAGYQRESAWTWEHQALLRARAIVGDEALCARFEALRVEILCRPREPVQLARDVADMRARMIAALGTSPPGRMHLKRDPGGLTDLEFVVQYLALAHAAAHPDIVRHSDNVRVVEAARDAGVLSDDDARALLEAWLTLRARALEAGWALEGPEIDADPELEAVAERVRALRASALGPLA